MDTWPQEYKTIWQIFFNNSRTGHFGAVNCYYTSYSDALLVSGRMKMDEKWDGYTIYVTSSAPSKNLESPVN